MTDGRQPAPGFSTSLTDATEIIGLGRYGFTLTVLSGEELPLDPEDDEDEEERLIDSWTPRFAYRR